MCVTSSDVQTALSGLFSRSNIGSTFSARIAPSQLRGIDRQDTNGFAKSLDAETSIIRDKCLSGSYRFSPYLELLRPKGRDVPPRVIAIPTVRDRIVLLLLKELLHFSFPKAVPRRLPNEYARELKNGFAGWTNAAVARADIASFYDSVDHRRLLDALATKLPSNVLRLIERAIRNPTVPLSRRAGAHRSLLPLGNGIPQGLAVSNILAEIYVQRIDSHFCDRAIRYFRYVDDILMVAKGGSEETLYNELTDQLSQIGLELNKAKRFTGGIGDTFDYLGYRFRLPTVSVRLHTRDQFIDSLARQFVSYTKSGEARYGARWLDANAQQRLFLEELNERITGAVSENRRYGWLFYFLEINDLGLLYQLDQVVQDLWNRYLVSESKTGLKRFVRAYWEARYNQRGNYVHNYNAYTTLTQKLDFLHRRGFLDPDSEARFTDEQIEVAFARARNLYLSRLEADVGVIS